MSLIKYILVNKRLLVSFIIFKEKRYIKTQYKILKNDNAYINLSENN